MSIQATQKITLPTLVELLAAQQGSTIVTLELCTKPKLTKKHRETKEECPYGTILKMSRVNAMIGVNYENCVNNQLAREGRERAFEAQERTWGENVEGSPLIRKPGKEGEADTVYLQYKPNRKLGDTRFVLESDGTEVSHEALKPYLPLPSKPSGNQGTDSEVQFNTVKLENVTAITMRSTRYELVEA